MTIEKYGIKINLTKEEEETLYNTSKILKEIQAAIENNLGWYSIGKIFDAWYNDLNDEPSIEGLIFNY